MNNKILIQTRTSKKPLNNGKFVEKTTIQLLLNGVILYQYDTDEYCITAQELMEKMLNISSKLIEALEKTGNNCLVQHTRY